MSDLPAGGGSLAERSHMVEIEGNAVKDDDRGCMSQSINISQRIYAKLYMQTDINHQFVMQKGICTLFRA